MTSSLNSRFIGSRCSFILDIETVQSSLAQRSCFHVFPILVVVVVVVVVMMMMMTFLSVWDRVIPILFENGAKSGRARREDRVVAYGPGI